MKFGHKGNYRTGLSILVYESLGSCQNANTDSVDMISERHPGMMMLLVHRPYFVQE